MLDLCCSYGINAALLNHDHTLDALYARYCSTELAALSSDELVVADRAFYREHRHSHPVQVVGIDVAKRSHVVCAMPANARKTPSRMSEIMMP